MIISETIASKLGLKLAQVNATIALFDEGNTLPFIARYRKEATGELDEEQIRQISILLERLRSIEARRETILASIEEQGKLSEELIKKMRKTLAKSHPPGKCTSRANQRDLSVILKS